MFRVEPDPHLFGFVNSNVGEKISTPVTVRADSSIRYRYFRRCELLTDVSEAEVTFPVAVMSEIPMDEFVGVKVRDLQNDATPREVIQEEVLPTDTIRQRSL